MHSKLLIIKADVDWSYDRDRNTNCIIYVNTQKLYHVIPKEETYEDLIECIFYLRPIFY